MSLATVLTHLDDARDALAAALTAKGLTVSESITINGCADKIGDLPDVGAVDVSDTTATAADVLSGAVFYLADGTQTSGTIPTVSASLAANVTTVPAGYIAAAQTLTVAEAGAASVSGNVVTIPVGYIASQRTVTVGTAVAAQTITPGTTDQTIAADSYLSGAATIKGDANLIAANIASGVTIFGVTGTASGGSGGTDVSDTTATAATVLSGYDFYNSSGVKTSGSIQTVTASASGNVVTVPAGYISSSQTLTIGTAVAAQTITPGTTDQTIAADSYLSGAATIKGDANLIAANIASGVTIFGVTGTASGGSGGTDVSPTTAEAGDVLSGKIFFTSGGVQTSGTIPTVSASLAANVTTVPAGYIAASQTLTVPLASSATVSGGIVTIPAGYVASDYTVSAGGGSATDFFRCTTVTSGGSAWTGNKAVLSGGKYSYESAVTSGLSYGSGFTPEVGKVYADGALIQANLYDGIPKDSLVFYAPLSSAAQTAETGQSLTTSGTISYGSVAGIPCATFDGSSYISFPDTNLPTLKNDCSFSVWAKHSMSGTGYFVFYYGIQSYDGTACGISKDANGTIGWDWGANAGRLFQYSGADTWQHICFVCSNQTAYMYLNGVLQTNFTYDIGWDSVSTSKTGTASIGARIQGGNPWNFPGSIAGLRIYNRALTADEISALAAEFTPSAS